MHRGVRTLTVLLAFGVLIALAACGNGQTGGQTNGEAGSATITLQNTQFNPATLTVKTGAVVKVENKDSVAHDIVIGTDDLGEQAAGQSKTWTAPKDGVYWMKCLIHASMSGQITVGAGGDTIGTPPAGGTTGGGGYGY